MHLSVLNLTKSASLETAMALASVGRIEESVEMARCIRRHAATRSLLGQLAVMAPEKTLPLVGHDRFANIRTYCRLALGETVVDERGLPPLLAMDVALRAGKMELARAYFETVFRGAGLTAPVLDWADTGIDVNTARCQNESVQLDESAPLVSIILTAHNEEHYLSTAVRSILAQSWKKLELILIDDGSSDGTHRVACEIGESDGRVRVFRLESNSGTWYAKNFGLKQVLGKFITMHDADDWSHPEKISRQLCPLLNNPQLMCSSSYMFRVAENSGLPFTRNASSFLRWNPSSLLFRRRAVDELGDYFTDLLGGDCEFAARIESRWGAASHTMIRLPLSMGWHRVGSLSDQYRDASDTLLRLRHWEDWRRRHALARANSGLLGFRKEKLKLFEFAT
jgi:hypothetical protein